MKTRPEEWTEKPQIIVVDDNPANLRLLMDILAYEGYEVRPANSGKLAVAAAIASPPDMILLDVLLPDRNGYEVCMELKSLKAFEDIPVIFISGLDDEAEKANAFACGAVDYITKPFKHKEIIARVKTHLEARMLRRKLSDIESAEEKADIKIQELQNQNDLLKRELEDCKKECEKYRK